MSYEVKILCDSIAYGTRLTTFMVTMPRFLLAEFNTHRRLSRNSASSRAIPVEKRISMLESEPFVPEAFQQNIRGMQAGDVLDPLAQAAAKRIWVQASKAAIRYAKLLSALKVHKQWANRLLEPFAWHTVICTATEWENFFNLRVHPDAQPEIQIIAKMMKDAMNMSQPNQLKDGEWHIPFITYLDIEEATKDSGNTDWLWLVKLSVARCARVSYLTHDTGKRDVAKDLELHDRLQSSGHMSPFEHCAQVVKAFNPDCASNFDFPWKQYRKFIPGEAIYRGHQ